MSGMSEELLFSSILNLKSEYGYEWQEGAKCVNESYETFFPDEIDPTTGRERNARSWAKANQEAKLICSTCSVREQCLWFALEKEEQYGVWGGLSTPERNALLNKPNWRHQQEKAKRESQANAAQER